MPVTCVFGAQWGDEGKGKVVDFLARDADYVVRFQGGSQGAVGVIANGVVLDAPVLRDELAMLEAHGIARDLVRVSDRSHLVLPFHGPLDRALDASRNDLWRNNTTGRGISTCAADKVRYDGFRVADLLSERVRAERLSYLLKRGNLQLEALGEAPLDVAAATAEVESWVDLLRPLACDTGRLLRGARAAGKFVLLEGAQAALLDVDFGTYPFVTSSSTGANGISSGTGLPPRAIDRIVAVAKAYMTRVGSDAGPFPTRETGEIGERLQERGKEFGTVTGRPRRCGWFDAVAARHVCQINGVDALAITKIDVLQGLDPLRICVAYEVDGRRLDEFPSDIDALRRARPVYRDLPGFSEALGGARTPEDLPALAAAYVRALAEEVGAPVELLSVGPERTETVTLEAR
jgi:adenylosuccinate synthase